MPVPLAGKMSAPELFCCFSSHLNPASKKLDQGLSDFHTGIGAAAHATFDTEQIISHNRTLPFDTIASIQDSYRGVFPVSKVYELLPWFMSFWTMM